VEGDEIELAVRAFTVIKPANFADRRVGAWRSWRPDLTGLARRPRKAPFPWRPRDSLPRLSPRSWLAWRPRWAILQSGKLFADQALDTQLALGLAGADLSERQRRAKPQFPFDAGSDGA
jgi:hypothetical protein